MGRLELGKILDAHVHLWDPLTTPREASSAARLYRAAPKLFETAFPLIVSRANRTFIQTPHYVGRPFLPQHYREAIADRGLRHHVDGWPTFEVESFIHIEASWKAEGLASVDETRWISKVTAGQRPDLLGIVAHVDPRWRNLDSVLDTHLNSAEATGNRVVGVRCSAAHHVSPSWKSWIEAPGTYASTGFLHGFAEIAARGLSFDAWVYSHQLGDVVQLAREYPETRIIIDHYCAPPGLLLPASDRRAPTANDLSHWKDHLLQLADLPNIYAKHSGIGMPVLGYSIVDQPITAMTPYISEVTEIFGTERVIFGSNIPMDLPNTNYHGLVSAIAHGVLSSRSASIEDLSKIFRSNALNAYGLLGEHS